MDREALEEALDTLNGSIFFIIVIVGSILLSWLSLLKQRQQVREALTGSEVTQDCSVFPLRLGSSALILGALGFFFCMALRRRVQACGGEDPVEKRSSLFNAAASTLVLGAALLRLEDLLFVERSGQNALTEPEEQPHKPGSLTAKGLAVM